LKNDLLSTLYSFLKKLLPGLKENTSKSNESKTVNYLRIEKESDFLIESFPPFLSEEFVKASKQNNSLLSNGIQLLTETTLRFSSQIWSMVPEEAFNESQTENWKNIACEFIATRSDLFENHSKQLLFDICKTQDMYLQALDHFEFNSSLEILKSTWEKIQDSLDHSNDFSIIQLSSNLSKLCEFASKRPQNWKKYCLESPSMLTYLFDFIFILGTERALATIKLLRLSLSASNAIQFLKSIDETKLDSKNQKNSRENMKVIFINFLFSIFYF